MSFGGKVSPYEQTTERKCLQHVWAEIVDMFLCIEFFCVLQDARFVDLLMAVSVMKVFLSRGNKRCGEVRCLCCTL